LGTTYQVDNGEVNGTASLTSNYTLLSNTEGFLNIIFNELYTSGNATRRDQYSLKMLEIVEFYDNGTAGFKNGVDQVVQTWRVPVGGWSAFVGPVNQSSFVAFGAKVENYMEVIGQVDLTSNATAPFNPTSFWINTLDFRTLYAANNTKLAIKFQISTLRANNSIIVPRPLTADRILAYFNPSLNATGRPDLELLITDVNSTSTNSTQYTGYITINSTDHTLVFKDILLVKEANSSLLRPTLQTVFVNQTTATNQTNNSTNSNSTQTTGNMTNTQTGTQTEATGGSTQLPATTSIATPVTTGMETMTMTSSSGKTTTGHQASTTQVVILPPIDTHENSASSAALSLFLVVFAFLVL